MIKITFEEENNRAVAFDDATEIGECTFARADKVWIIDHTFVTPSYGGQGIAKKLVAEVVKHAREAEVKIMPLCPFAKREFVQNDEYQDMWAK
ncbi:GNAT family N-acetyltransferase [Atopobacter phocae]|uniref:GNAT family N-acetyltransferase n=1 Tax=Atopobacter phocae TaxID=136492 RepID=UPI0004BBF45C|nr:GNAT family N-acetyltransferase [Atopobacter phocae]